MKRLTLLTIFCIVAAALAEGQCYDGTTLVTKINHVLRTGGNVINSGAGTQVTGDYWAYWDEYANWHEWQNSTDIYDGTVYDGPYDQGLAYSEWTHAPSSQGPGTYTLYVYHQVDSICGDSFNWYEGSPGLTVNKPTITQSNASNALPQSLWNMGPGTDLSIPTSGGYTYYQSITLTINTQCGSGDTCNDTPTWSISSPANTLQLSSTSGTSVTLSKGSSMGNCSFDTPVSVSIGGFSSAAVTFLVNSPGSVVSRSDLNLTEDLSPGYRSNISWQVGDVCAGGTDRLTTLPLYEAFQSWAFPGAISGWGADGAESASGFNYGPDPTVFRDYIYASDNTYNPAPVFTTSGPPYTYSTVITTADHQYYVGTDTFSGGTQVFSGHIWHYRDHGDTF